MSLHSGHFHSMELRLALNNPTQLAAMDVGGREDAVTQEKNHLMVLAKEKDQQAFLLKSKLS